MDKQLNILMVCKTLPWQFKGGIQTHTWELAKALTDRGHKISILNAGSIKKKTKVSEVEGIEIIQIPYIPGRYIKPLSVLAEELAFNWSAKQWVKENHERFDIIHAQGRSGYLLYTIKGIRKKLITTVHGLIEIESARYKWYNLDKRFHKMMATRYERRQLAASQMLIAVSQDLKSQITAPKQKHIEVINNGVRLGKIGTVAPIEKDHNKFLFIGRLHPVKNILPLVNAMAKSHPSLKLDIVGDGELREQIAAVITNNKLGDRIKLIGELTGEEINQIMPNYQALVLPSLYETQGIVLIEANAHAIPVIASDIPAIRETVEHEMNGLLCDPNKVETFVEAMAYLSNVPQLAQHMGLKGQVKVQANFLWTSIADKTEKAYHKIEKAC
ncbi:glycosyltransferase family 4 protein [Roseivirga pacifica]|uniref:glycosyltransferase family 4 protein n=1 Tax=Roseivirga pacifica TaxID=1267423 RepID=UPI003BB108AC